MGGQIIVGAPQIDYCRGRGYAGDSRRNMPHRIVGGPYLHMPHRIVGGMNIGP